MTPSPFFYRTVFALLTSLGVLWISAQAASPIEQEEIDRAIADLREGGDLSRADLVRNLIELKCRHASDDVKLQSLDSLIQLGASVLSTRERTIDTNAKIGIWPEFDGLAYGSKFPIFAGADPEGITDAKVRDAYKAALSKHNETLTRLSSEKRKAEVAGESLLAAKRIMEQMNSPEAVARVTQALSKLAADQWIADTARLAIFPPPPPDRATGESVQPSGTSKAASTTPDLSIMPKPPSPPKAPEANPAAASEEPTSPKPWSVVVVLMVAAIGLLWLVLRKR